MDESDEIPCSPVLKTNLITTIGKHSKKIDLLEAELEVIQRKLDLFQCNHCHTCNAIIASQNEKPDVPRDGERWYSNYRLLYVEGFAQMRITCLKSYISNICNVDKKDVANLDYVNSNVVEVVVSASASAKIIACLSHHVELNIVDSMEMILSDKEGVLRRMKRLDSARIKNNELRTLYQNLLECFESDDMKRLEVYLAENVNFNVDNYRTAPIN